MQRPAISRIVAFDRAPDRLDRFLREMEAAHGRSIGPSRDVESAVREADIIVTATEIRKHPTPIIRPEWIKPGAFCMPVDFDAQFTPAAIQSMDLFYSDDTPQMEFYRTMGYFGTTPKVQGDLGEVVTGRSPGRTRLEQRTMAMHLGLAIEDMATAIRIYGKAARQGIGTRLPL